MNTVKALEAQFDRNVRKLEELRSRGDDQDPVTLAAIHNAETCLAQICTEIIEATQDSVPEETRLTIIERALHIQGNGTVQ